MLQSVHIATQTFHSLMSPVQLSLRYVKAFAEPTLSQMMSCDATHKINFSTPHLVISFDIFSDVREDFYSLQMMSSFSLPTMPKQLSLTHVKISTIYLLVTCNF